jgi:hypothetical protein
MRRLTFAVVIMVVLVTAGTWPDAAQRLEPRAAAGPVRFAVIGDNGTGEPPQYEVGAQMAAVRARFPFEFVVMLGDNMYGRQRAEDFVTKFERPYAALLQAGVRFYATLGNHDDQDNREYRGFNMQGERHYTFAAGPVRFFTVDTNLMDRVQLAWLDQTLARSDDPWKIVFFHHPIYSDGRRHGSNVELRVLLEPLLLRHGVSVVFSGHEHVYERLVPQRGIAYFIAGSGGQLRRGGVARSAMTAAAYDEDRCFMLVEIAGDRMTFETISRTGEVVDAGEVARRVTGTQEEQP